jgi:hypothetical protein
MHTRSTSAGTLTALALLAASARAQCPVLDASFGRGPATLNARVNALAVFDDGSGSALYAGGRFSLGGGSPVGLIARWTGSTWSPLDTGIGITSSFNEVFALAVWDDGTGAALYVGGKFTEAGGQPANYIAKWDGSAWSPLGVGVDLSVRALAVWDDGTGAALYVGGDFDHAGGNQAHRIARWNGATWSTLGMGLLSNGPESLAVFDDGSGPALYACGAFTSAGGVPAGKVARWNGSTWSAVGGTGTNAYAQTLLVHDDGSGPALYMGGAFTSVDGSPCNHIARWNGASWTPLAGGLAYYVQALATYDAGLGPRLFAGEHESSDAHGASLVSEWDGANWTPLGAGVGGISHAGYESDRTVSAMTSFDDGGGSKLFVGGDFTTAGDVAAQRLARWDGHAWSAIGSMGSSVDNGVYAQQVFDDGSGPALYAAGAFASAGSHAIGRIAKWDGAAWSDIGAGISSPGSTWAIDALAVLDEGGAPTLCAAGRFELIGGVAAHNVASWDGNAWSPFGSGLDGVTYTLAAFDDGNGSRLYAAGYYFTSPSQTVAPIKRWMGNGWEPISPSLDDIVYALCVHDGALFAAGSFTSPASHVIRWTISGSSTLGSGTNGNVYALASFDDGSGPALYAGGQFTTAGGVSAANVARWNGSSWSSLGSGTNGAVRSLCVFDDGTGPALYVGGSFSNAGSFAASSLARWNGSSWSAVTNSLTAAVVLSLATFDDHSGGGPDLYLGIQSALGVTAPPATPFAAEVHGCSQHVVSFCDGGSLCPCGNSGQPGHGCDNSAATGGAILVASGTTSPDTLVLSSASELPSALTIFLQGDHTISPVPFGDGVRCAGGHLLRLYTKSASSGVATAPTGGDLPVTQRSQALGDAIAPGSQRYYQAYYRDPSGAFCPPPAGSTFNASNGLIVLW